MPFVESNPTIRKAIEKWLRTTLSEAAVYQALEWGLRAVEEYTMSNQNASPYYTDIAGNLWTENTMLVAANADGSLRAVSTEVLVNSLKLVRANQNDLDPANHTTIAILIELQRRMQDEASVIEVLFNQQAQLAEEVAFDNQAPLEQVPPVVGSAAVRGIDFDYIRRFLESGVKKFFRSLVRSGSDRFRVSREPHEFRYCMDSGQFDEVINDCFMWDSSNGNILSDIPNVKTLEDTTYGDFCDMANVRKMIGRNRLLRRIAFSANVKKVMDQLSSTREGFYDSLKLANDYNAVRDDIIKHYRENS